jgi:putative ABC transport system permease protein
MSLSSLAFSNFKRSVREYRALIISLAFSVFIFFNFQNILYSDSMEVLNSMKKDYIDMIVKAACAVFGVFLFFFIWYATNVFLNQRKKEIGIYTFMGLDNVRIGKMYALEAFFIGGFSLLAGLLAGVGFSKLFQMMLMRMSDISVNIRFSIALKPIGITAAVFLIIFSIMIGKGYFAIVSSSVLSMLSGAKQEEMRPEKAWATIIKTVVGAAVLTAGYGCALKTGDESSLNYALMAVILVIAGVYLLFGGAIPFFVRKLTEQKNFLYKKQRTLWMNNLAYRIKRNYRTYAMVTILMICSVTVLGLSIAMKQRYDKMTHFRDTFTYQIISSQELDTEEIEAGISRENQVEYRAEAVYLLLDPSFFHTKYVNNTYGIIPFSQLKNISRQADLPLQYNELGADETILLSHVMLMSLAHNDPEREVQIGDSVFQMIGEDDTPFLGEMQSQMDIYVLNDEKYKELESKGMVLHMYNFKIVDLSNAEASRPYLTTLAKADENGQFQTGVNMNSPENKTETWIRVMYSLCIFMFVTLILAGGSIIFIKLNNDAYEDRSRYLVLVKMGVETDILYKSMKNEIRFTYYCPFVLMCVSSWFATKALGNVMREDLFRVNIYSAASILLIFTIIYFISVKVFKKRTLDF